MEKTGHRSLEGYKRTNMEQQENLSDILSATKRPAIQSSSAPVSSDTACQSILKTKSTQLSKEITIKTQETLKHMFTLKNCNNVSIQVNLKKVLPIRKVSFYPFITIKTKLRALSIDLYIISPLNIQVIGYSPHMV